MVTDASETTLDPSPDLHYLPAWSRDWTRLGYVAYGQTSGPAGYSVVVDGLKGKDYPSVWSPEFSPDGRHIAHAVSDNATGKSFVVVDGVEGRPNDSLLFNRTFMPQLEERIGLFDASDRVHYVAAGGGSLYLVEETLRCGRQGLPCRQTRGRSAALTEALLRHVHGLPVHSRAFPMVRE